MTTICVFKTNYIVFTKEADIFIGRGTLCRIPENDIDYYINLHSLSATAFM